MKSKWFVGKFELLQGKIIAKIPLELAQKYKITNKTRYRLVSEEPKKLAIVVD